MVMNHLWSREEKKINNSAYCYVTIIVPVTDGKYYLKQVRTPSRFFQQYAVYISEVSSKFLLFLSYFLRPPRHKRQASEFTARTFFYYTTCPKCVLETENSSRTARTQNAIIRWCTSYRLDMEKPINKWSKVVWNSQCSKQKYTFWKF